jgi:hypothetical protein
LLGVRATQRATAKVLGVNEVTIARDVGKERGATNVAKQKTSPQQKQGVSEAVSTYVASPPSSIPQSGEEVAKLAEKAAASKAKKEETFSCLAGEVGRGRLIKKVGREWGEN